MRSAAFAACCALLTTGGYSSAQQFAPDFRPTSNLVMAKLRADIMARPTFDRIVPPTSDRMASGTDYSGSGTDVNMQIRFFKVQVVNAAEGWMRLKVWMRMRWMDTRLAWNASEYDGLTTAYFNADKFSGDEVTELWIPDIQPYNANQGLVMTLEPSSARVTSDGEVFLSRPGSLDIMCKFSGLVAFPFDQLKCGVEFGGWGFSGGQQGIKLMDGGYAFSNQELTSGSSYQENEIIDVQVYLTTYSYDCCPSEPLRCIKSRSLARPSSTSRLASFQA